MRPDTPGGQMGFARPFEALEPLVHAAAFLGEGLGRLLTVTLPTRVAPARFRAEMAQAAAVWGEDSVGIRTGRPRKSARSRARSREQALGDE